MSIRSCESNSEAEEESGGIRGFEEKTTKGYIYSAKGCKQRIKYTINRR